MGTLENITVTYHFDEFIEDKAGNMVKSICYTFEPDLCADEAKDINNEMIRILNYATTNYKNTVEHLLHGFDNNIFIFPDISKPLYLSIPVGNGINLIYEVYFRNKKLRTRLVNHKSNDIFKQIEEKSLTEENISSFISFYPDKRIGRINNGK